MFGFVWPADRFDQPATINGIKIGLPKLWLFIYWPRPLFGPIPTGSCHPLHPATQYQPKQMPSDPSLSKKAYHEEAERAGLKKDGQAASGEIRVSSQNFIRTGLHSAVQAYGLVAGQLEKLPQAQRMGVLAIAAFILFWPLFGVVMVVPWIFGGFILAYSLLLGFETLINHTEEALLNELTISPAVTSSHSYQTLSHFCRMRDW